MWMLVQLNLRLPSKAEGMTYLHSSTAHRQRQRQRIDE